MRLAYPLRFFRVVAPAATTGRLDVPRPRADIGDSRHRPRSRPSLRRRCFRFFFCSSLLRPLVSRSRPDGATTILLLTSGYGRCRWRSCTGGRRLRRASSRGSFLPSSSALVERKCGATAPGLGHVGRAGSGLDAAVGDHGAPAAFLWRDWMASRVGDLDERVAVDRDLDRSIIAPRSVSLLSSAWGFLVYPAGLVGHELRLSDFVTVAPALVLACGSMAAACRWVSRASVPLEAAQ